MVVRLERREAHGVGLVVKRQAPPLWVFLST